MPAWNEERAELLGRIRRVEADLKAILDSKSIWHRVRQTATRSLEQAVIAREQIELQEHAL